MRRIEIQRLAAAATGLALLAMAGAASAASLTHAYDFNTDGQVLDSVGSSNAALVGGATVSGGVLTLNGAGATADFSDYLIPGGAGAYSVYLRVAGAPNINTHTEIISQGFSGNGFYIGTAPGGAMRFTDGHTSTSVLYPTDGLFHDFLLTNSVAGMTFSIDGTTVFTDTQYSISLAGTATRLGGQFNPYSEYFNGQIDTLKIFDGVATLADVNGAGGVPEPAAWALMLAGFGLAGATLRRRRAGLAA